MYHCVTQSLFREETEIIIDIYSNFQEPTGIFTHEMDVFQCKYAWNVEGDLIQMLLNSWANDDIDHG